MTTPLEIVSSEYVHGVGVTVVVKTVPRGLRIGDHVLAYHEGDAPPGPSVKGRARMWVKRIAGRKIVLLCDAP